MFLWAPYRLQVGALQSSVGVSGHPETTTKPRIGFECQLCCVCVHCVFSSSLVCLHCGACNVQPTIGRRDRVVEQSVCELHPSNWTDCREILPGGDDIHENLSRKARFCSHGYCTKRPNCAPHYCQRHKSIYHSNKDNAVLRFHGNIGYANTQ